jgi:pimeloyl-ACP methyl ester carboxylesterase
MWQAQRTAFAERFDIHTPTLPGHNVSTSDDYTSHTRAARSIAEQIHLDDLEGDIVVIGFSVGGQVAIEFATLFADRVTRTVAISSLVRPWRTAALYVSLAGLAAPLAKRRDFARLQATQLGLLDADIDAYVELSRHLSPTTLRNIVRTNFSFSPSAEFLRSPRPVLLLAGDHEQRTLITNLRALATTVPIGRFELVASTAHSAPFTAPDDVNELLDEWLAPHTRVSRGIHPDHPH